MTTQERMMEAAKLRLRFQVNNRLRLESLAALSKVFREHQEPVRDELLASLVLAVPEELLGEMDAPEDQGLQAKAPGVPRPSPGVGVPRPSPGVGVPRPSPGAGVPRPSPSVGVPRPSPGAGHGKPR
jgi:hypothetical protein